MSDRALTSPVAVALLLVVAVAVAGTLGAAALEMADRASAPARPVAVAVEADASGQVRLVHRGGRTLDVRDLRVRLAVDDEPLAHQPPVPFFSATGFRSGPTGPFNPAADPTWGAGESASLRVARTNEPPLVQGADLRVRLVYRGRTVWSASVTVQPAGAASTSRSPAGLGNRPAGPWAPPHGPSAASDAPPAGRDRPPP